MVNYSIEKLNLIKEYIQTESEEVYYKNFGDRYDIIMIVDWGEFDTDIIEYCEAILQTKQLSVEEIDIENEQGFEIIITYEGKKTTIPYQGEGADRNTTIITLNETIQPDYEIRWCKISDGNDTLTFIPLPKQIWTNLDKEYPEKIDRLFERIDKNSNLF